MARRRQLRYFQMAAGFPWTKLACRPWFDRVQLSYANLRAQQQFDWLFDGSVVHDTYQQGSVTPTWRLVEFSSDLESVHGS